MEKTYEVAGLKFTMDSWGRTIAQAEPYEIPPQDQVDFELKSSWPEKKAEYPCLSDGDGEYLATGSVFYKHLLEYGGMMLHSSAVGRPICFLPTAARENPPIPRSG